MAALRRTDPAFVTYTEAEYMEGVIEELLMGRIQGPGTSAPVNGVASTTSRRERHVPQRNLKWLQSPTKVHNLVLRETVNPGLSLETSLLRIPEGRSFGLTSPKPGPESEMEEFKQILEDTYDQRRLIAASPLPEFFLYEEIGPVPKYRTDDSPRIYTMGGHLWINAGTPAETIKIASGSLERALVLCLVLYYVKYLDYPEAFWRVLYVLQFVLNPSDVPPTPPTGRNGQTCEVTEKMRCLVDLLTSEEDTSESKGVTLAICPLEQTCFDHRCVCFESIKAYIYQSVYI
ncbi:hypothetical protein MRX96_033167 [Rhipicephalus microplus]